MSTAELRAACRTGNAARAREILAANPAGLDVNQPDAAAGGETPLMAAARVGSVECVELLLRHGADRTVRTAGGQTAVDFAPPAVKAVLKDGSDGSYLPSLRQLVLMTASWNVIYFCCTYAFSSIMAQHYTPVQCPPAWNALGCLLSCLRCAHLRSLQSTGHRAMRCRICAFLWVLSSLPAGRALFDLCPMVSVPASAWVMACDKTVTDPITVTGLRIYAGSTGTNDCDTFDVTVQGKSGVAVAQQMVVSEWNTLVMDETYAAGDTVEFEIINEEIMCDGAFTVRYEYGSAPPPAPCYDTLLPDGRDWFGRGMRLYTCDWIAQKATQRCKQFGSASWNNTDFPIMGQQACCACGGGGPTPPTVPTLSPPTPAPLTPAPPTPSPPTAAPLTPVPKTAVPPTQSPGTQEPPTPSPLTASPPTPAPPTPIPATLIPPTPAPPPAVTAIPQTPSLVPGETMTPPSPAPPTPAPLTPAPPTPAPPTPIPATLIPPTPAPPPAVTAIPQTPSPVTAIPQTPSPVPGETMTPPSPAPLTPAPLTPSPPTSAPATSAPIIPEPPTSVPLTSEPTTTTPKTAQPATPQPPQTISPSAPALSPSPPTAGPLTLPPPTPAPETTEAPTTLAPQRTAVTSIPGPLAATPEPPVATHAPSTSVVPFVPMTLSTAMPPAAATSVPTNPPPKTALSETRKKTQAVAAAAGTTAVVAGVAAGAGPAMRLAAVAAECGPEVGRGSRYGRMMSPLQLTLHQSDALGALVGNAALAVGTIVLAYTVSQLTGVVGKKVWPRFFEEMDAQGVTKFPSASLLVFSLLYQGTSFAAMDLILAPGDGWFVPVGCLGVILCLVVPGLTFHTVSKNIPSLAFVRADTRTRDGLACFILGEGEWVSRQRKPHWIERWSSAVRMYRQPVGWFSVIEYSASFAISAVKSAFTDTYIGCGHAKVASALIFAGLLYVEATLLPHLHMRNNYADLVILVAQVAAMLGLAKGYYSENEDDEGFGFGMSILGVCGYLLIARTALDLFVLLYVFITGRRRRLQREQFAEASPDDNICEMVDVSDDLASAETCAEMSLCSIQHPPQRCETGGTELTLASSSGVALPVVPGSPSLAQPPKPARRRQEHRPSLVSQSGAQTEYSLGHHLRTPRGRRGAPPRRSATGDLSAGVVPLPSPLPSPRGALAKDVIGSGLLGDALARPGRRRRALSDKVQDCDGVVHLGDAALSPVAVFPRRCRGFTDRPSPRISRGGLASPRGLRSPLQSPRTPSPEPAAQTVLSFSLESFTHSLLDVSASAGKDKDAVAAPTAAPTPSALRQRANAMRTTPYDPLTRV